MRRVSIVTLALCSSPQPCAALDVTVSAFTEVGYRRVGYGGTLVVSVPWGRWFGEPAPNQLAALAQEAGGELPGSESDVDPDTTQAETQDAAPTEPEPGPAKLPAAAVDGEVVAPPSAQLSPAFVGALVDAALQEYDRLALRLDSIASRSRSSAWLPSMSLRAGRNIDQTLRLTPTDSDPDRWQLTGGADLRLEAQLKWEFDRLLYASDELAVERIRLAAAQRRAQLVDRVLDWLFRWQLAELQAADVLADPLERAAAGLRALQAVRALDVLSGGWFTPHLNRERQRAAAPAQD